MCMKVSANFDLHDPGEIMQGGLNCIYIIKTKITVRYWTSVCSHKTNKILILPAVIISGMEALWTFSVHQFKENCKHNLLFTGHHFQRAPITLVHFHHQNSRFSEEMRHIVWLFLKFYMTGIVVWTVSSYCRSLCQVSTQNLEWIQQHCWGSHWSNWTI